MCVYIYIIIIILLFYYYLLGVRVGVGKTCISRPVLPNPPLKLGFGPNIRILA
jgi:hypothetical protein